MAFARFERAIVDEAGNVVRNVWVEVRREGVAGNPKESLKGDWLGDTTLSNPAFFEDGVVAFHAAGGFFQIHAYGPGYDKTWHHVAIGLGAGSDIRGFVPMGAWDSVSTYEIGDVVTHPDSDGVLHLFASKVNDNLDEEPDVSPPQDTAYWAYIGVVAEAPLGKAIAMAMIFGG